MTTATKALIRAQLAVRNAIDRTENEDGDVPGWVLVTLMTAGLVTAIWAIAGKRLGEIFQQAINSVKGP